MKYLIFLLSLWPICTVTGQQVVAPSSKADLVRELAKMGCRFYVGEPGRPLSRDKYGRIRFHVHYRGEPEASRIRGIQIDERFNGRKPFPQMLAKAVREHFSDVEVLHLDRHPSAIQAFSQELKHFTNLRYLSVQHPRQPRTIADDVAAKDMVNALAGLRELEVLELRSGWLTNELAESLQGHPKMTRLVLGNRVATNSLSAPMLNSIVSEMPELQYLETLSCRLAGKFQWATWARLKKLETIKFRWSEVTDEQLAGISKLDALRHLELSYAPITGAALIEISALANLKNLNIYHTRITSGISHLATKADLQLGCDPRMFTEPLSDDELALLLRMGVHGPYGSDQNDGEGAYSLLRMTKDFQSIDSITQTTNTTNIEQRPNKELKRSGKIIQLGRHLTEADFRNLKKLNVASLTYLKLVQSVSSEETQYLRELPNLQMVRLENARIDKAWISDLATNTSLESVVIETAMIEPEAFDTANEWKSIRLLQINTVKFASKDSNRCRGIEAIPNLTGLTLGGTSLVDDDVTHLARIKSLEGLTVHGSFTRSVIPTVAANPSLKSLGLIGLKLANVENDLLPLRGSTIKYVRLKDNVSPHFANIYSSTLAKRLGITMAGECSCGCMDVEPR